jgi:hypothetical protein
MSGNLWGSWQYWKNGNLIWTASLFCGLLMSCIGWDLHYTRNSSNEGKFRNCTVLYTGCTGSQCTLEYLYVYIYLHHPTCLLLAHLINLNTTILDTEHDASQNLLWNLKWNLLFYCLILLYHSFPSSTIIPSEAVCHLLVSIRFVWKPNVEKNSRKSFKDKTEYILKMCDFTGLPTIP